MQDNLGCIFDEAWAEVESLEHSEPVFGKNELFVCNAKIERGVTVETSAGRYENCLKISSRTNHMHQPGWLYRDHDKEYYFAPSIGLVRSVTQYGGAEHEKVIYDLTSYVGDGEGYMPCRAGIERHYSLVGADPDIHGSASYYYATDDNGKLMILADRKGTVDREQ